jgi:hypothetical protein
MFGRMYRYHLTIYFVDPVLRCFPHVVNRAVKAVLKAMTDEDLIKDAARDYEWDPLDTDAVFADCDVIALIRTLIRKVLAA